MSGGTSFPFLESEAKELCVGDIERLLGVYKDVVNKYTRLSQAVRRFSMSRNDIRALTTQAETKSDTTKEQEELCNNVELKEENHQSPKSY